MSRGPRLSVICRLSEPEGRTDPIVVTPIVRDDRATGVSVVQPAGGTRPIALPGVAEVDVDQGEFFKFAGLQSIVRQVLGGGVGTVLAFGPRKSGKGSTLVGREDRVTAYGYGPKLNSLDGLLPRAAKLCESAAATRRLPAVQEHQLSQRELPPPSGKARSRRGL